MKFLRHFTKSSSSPYEGVPFRLYRPTDEAGPVARFDAPTFWPDDTIATYFRLASRRCDIPVRTRPVRECDVPRWLWRRVPDRGALAEMAPGDRTAGERSARDVMDRVAGGIAYWGWHGGYFGSEDDAAAFVDEFRYLLCHRYLIGVPEHIRHCGIHWAYGVAGDTERHYVADYRTGRIVRADECHEPHFGPLLGRLALAQGGQETVIDLCNGKADTRGWLRQATGVRFRRSAAQWHTCPRSGSAGWASSETGFVFVSEAACPMMAIDVARFVGRKSGIDSESLEHAVRVATVALDIAHAQSCHRSRDVAATAWDHRPLALGLTNFAGLCDAAGVEYGSGAARALSAATTALVTATAYGVSAEMASIMGTFPEFEANRRPMLRAIHNHGQAAHGRTVGYQGLTRPPIPLDGAACPDEALIRRAQQGWDRAFAAGQRYGFRNAQVTLVPGPAMIREFDVPAGTAPQPASAIAPGAVSVDAQVRMMAAVQPFLSGAIGTPVVLPPNFGFHAATAVYQLAWRLGLKGLTVTTPDTVSSDDRPGLRLLGGGDAVRSGVAAGDRFDS